MARLGTTLSANTFADSLRARGWENHVMRRYDSGCEGSGLCLTGCPKAKKQGMSVTYVPWALRLGARIYKKA